MEDALDLGSSPLARIGVQLSSLAPNNWEKIRNEGDKYSERSSNKNGRYQPRQEEAVI